MSGVERVEHGDTHSPGRVLHTLAQGRAKFSGQRLVMTEMRCRQAPGQECYSIWTTITQLKTLCEEVLPDRLCVQQAAGNR